LRPSFVGWAGRRGPYPGGTRTKGFPPAVLGYLRAAVGP